MRVPRELAEKWEAKLRAEGLGLVEERRRTEGAHIERRYRRESAEYWAMAAEYAEYLCGAEARLRLSAEGGFARAMFGRLSREDLAVWRMHSAGLPRWMIAVALGKDPRRRDIRTTIERCSKQMWRWRKQAMRESSMEWAADVSMHGEAVDMAAGYLLDAWRIVA